MAEQVAATQCFGIEYERAGVNRLMSVRFWKGDSLCRVFACRSGLPFLDMTGELGSLSRFLSVVSTKTDIVACSGCPVELICTIDRCGLFSRAVQSCFRFEHLDLQTVMHKPTYSVFGPIDFFFGSEKFLAVLMVALNVLTTIVRLGYFHLQIGLV